MGTEVLSGEVGMMKDMVWKLSSRVLLLEGFIKQQFGNVFWKFCEEQVKGNLEDLRDDGMGEDSVEDEEDEDDEGIINGGGGSGSSTVDEKPTVLAMPPMIPIVPKKHVQQSSLQSQQQQQTTSITNRKPIPPPPPLSLMRTNNNVTLSSKPLPVLSSSPSSNFHVKARNFLPKALATKTKLAHALPSISITPSAQTTATVTVHHRAGNNGITTSTTPGGGGGMSILKEKILDSVISNHSSSPTAEVKHRKSPAPVNAHQQRLSASSSSILTRLPLSGSSSSSSNQYTPVVITSTEDYGDYYGEDDDEEDEGDMMYGEGDEGYLPAELVSATLAGPDEGEEEPRHEPKKIRLSVGGASSSSSFVNGGNGNGSGSGGRQMRPNPCHARCQNRCHDIWTDGDRMGVFQTYWSIPTEEERREFVAARIERVDMATKRTEFSNFRTCTFKYYLPHPDNPWVQVCKNFFLATIDEKRSYIEKIAQSVKGDAGGEKVAAKNIPFRRRNQMQRNMDNYAGWMQGIGMDADQLLMMDETDADGQLLQYEGDQDQGDGDEYAEDDNENEDDTMLGIELKQEIPQV